MTPARYVHTFSVHNFVHRIFVCSHPSTHRKYELGTCLLCWVLGQGCRGMVSALTAFPKQVMIAGSSPCDRGMTGRMRVSGPSLAAAQGLGCEDFR